jgi:hypothetical protein
LPLKEDIDMARGARNKEKFHKECASIFRVGHVFASFKEVHQAITIFLDAWGVFVPHLEKKLHVTTVFVIIIIKHWRIILNIIMAPK